MANLEERRLKKVIFTLAIAASSIFPQKRPIFRRTDTNGVSRRLSRLRASSPFSEPRRRRGNDNEASILASLIDLHSKGWLVGWLVGDGDNKELIKSSDFLLPNQLTTS